MDQNKLEEIKKICKLIENTNNRKLKKPEQLQFAYQYWNLTEEDLTQIYDILAINYTVQNEKLASIIADFINTQRLSTIHRFSNKFYNGNLDYILKTTKQIRENGNWLSLYNLDDEFNKKSINNYPIRYSYLLKNGETFSIDKDKAQNILGILTENDIPTAKCIVTSSFPYYANDKIDKYIQKIKTIK